MDPHPFTSEDTSERKAPLLLWRNQYVMAFDQSFDVTLDLIMNICKFLFIHKDDTTPNICIKAIYIHIDLCQVMSLRVLLKSCQRPFLVKKCWIIVHFIVKWCLWSKRKNQFNIHFSSLTHRSVTFFALFVSAERVPSGKDTTTKIRKIGISFESIKGNDLTLMLLWWTICCLSIINCTE